MFPVLTSCHFLHRISKPMAKCYREKEMVSILNPVTHNFSRCKPDAYYGGIAFTMSLLGTVY